MRHKEPKLWLWRPPVRRSAEARYGTLSPIVRDLQERQHSAPCVQIVTDCAPKGLQILHRNQDVNAASKALVMAGRLFPAVAASPITTTFWPGRASAWNPAPVGLRPRW